MARVNKDARNVNITFDQKDFNQKFEANNKALKLQEKQDASMDMTQNDEANNMDPKEDLPLLPHQRSIEDIIVITRETIFKSLSMISHFENPIPYINGSPDRFFCMSVSLVILGAVLLIFSNLQKE
jgi:hypothetical protein